MKTGHKNQHKKNIVHTNTHISTQAKGRNTTQAQTDRRRCAPHSYTVTLHWQAEMTAWVWICVEVWESVWHMLSLHALGKCLKRRQADSQRHGWRARVVRNTQGLQYSSFYPNWNSTPLLASCSLSLPRPTVNSHTPVGPQRRGSETSSCPCYGSH